MTESVSTSTFRPAMPAVPAMPVMPVMKKTPAAALAWALALLALGAAALVLPAPAAGQSAPPPAGQPAAPSAGQPASGYQPPAPAPAATPTVAMPPPAAAGGAAPAPAAAGTAAPAPVGTGPGVAGAAPMSEAERITFRAAIDRALAQNTSVQQAVAEVLRAEALIEQTRSTSLPQVNANAAYTRYGYEIKFGPVVIQPHDVKTESGTVTVPLVSLASWAQWAHAIDNKTIAELSVADAKRRVAVAAANAFLMVITRHRTIDADQRALETARAHYDVAHQRQVAGAASRLEEVQAAQDVSNDEVLLEQATVELRRAQEALGVLLSGDGPFDAADEPDFADLPPIGEALSGVEQRRADVLLLAMRQTAAEHVLSDSWRDRAPSLALSFSEQLQQPSTGFALSHSWQAVLQLTVPIYDGGLRTGEKHERRALVDEAVANLTTGRVQARSDVRIAGEAMRLADQGLVSARRAAAQAHEALDIVNLSYGAGASTSLDVLDAQRRARDADTAVATAEDAARQARLDYLQGSGRFP
ncbi:MAG TPA: TolC family protein [Thermoanaerobaculia bacterium]|nr:TolC family protein [Thermoanaerobaculia bacterium]